MRKYVNLLREIHLKQIDVLRDKVIDLQNHPCTSIYSYEDTMRLDILSDWSLLSQSGRELSNGIKGMQRRLAGYRTALNGKERQLHSSRTPESVEESLDNSRKSFIGDKRLAEVERCFVKRKEFQGLPIGLSSSDKEEHEHKTRRQILRKQVNQMQKSIDELKSKMKNSRESENDAGRKKHPSTMSEIKTSKNDPGIKSKNNSIIQFNSMAKFKSQGAEHCRKESFLHDQGKPRPDDESPQRSVKSNKSIAMEDDIFSEQNILDDKTTPKYIKEDSQQTTNQTIVARKADADNDKMTSNDKNDNYYDTSDVRCASACSEMSTSSSLSQVAHDVTKLVRLSSRRPKGYVE